MMNRTLKTFLLITLLTLIPAGGKAGPLTSSEKPFALTISGGGSPGINDIDSLLYLMGL